MRGLSEWLSIALALSALGCGARTGLNRPPPDGATTPSVLLFGGTSSPSNPSQRLSDTWEWNGATWTKAGGGPSARIVTAMARLGDRVVMFGGEDSDGKYLDDTWEWDGAWHQRNVSGPPARGDHAMVTLGNVVILMGGYCGCGATGALNDTWQWDGTSWTNMNALGPIVGASESFAAAVLGDHIVAFDTHQLTSVFDGHSWTSTNAGGPLGRRDFAMASLASNVILFGGDAIDNTEFGDTWQFDGASWTKLDVAGPSARAGHAMATRGDSIILFGGLDSAGNMTNDTWIWQESAWKQSGASGPNARYAFAMSPAP